MLTGPVQALCLQKMEQSDVFALKKWGNFPLRCEKITPKALANFSPRLERSDNPGSTIKKSRKR